MAIVANVCDSFKLECLPTAAGIHLSGDTYKIAVYTSTATLSRTTTVYSATNEVVGAGYTAGGLVMVGLVAALDTGVAILDWTTDPLWNPATMTGRGALIYNSSKSNKAVAVLDFGGDITSTAGPFTITLPAATAAAATVRLA